MSFGDYGDDSEFTMTCEKYLDSVKQRTTWLRKKHGDEVADDFSKNESNLLERYNDKKDKTLWNIAGEQARRKLTIQRAVLLSMSLEEKAASKNKGVNST
ncbi:MAG: hypothetical protein PVJ67_01055 [Candidatus Pacearchaeota archaeon]|jgi:hypothetical protein